MWPDGRTYDGQWVRGLAHGKAVATTVKGETIEGIFENGKLKERIG